MLERRRYTRFHVHAEAVFSYKDHQGEIVLSKANTRDISSHGVFLFSDHPIDVGTTVYLDIYLNNAMNTHTNKTNAVITGTGQIVRATDQGMGVDLQSSVLKPSKNNSSKRKLS